MTLALISLAVALVPGLYRWLSSREFLARPDDPMQAERWLAFRSRSTYVSAAAALVCGIAQPGRFFLWLPLMWLASAIGGFHVRRAVFGERWSLGGYLGWTLRLVVAAWGFWLLLAAAPWILIRLTGWGPALGLSVVLLAWQYWYAPVLLRVLSARPLAAGEHSPALADGFHRVIERARLASPPSIWRAGPAESMLANAVAIPSASGASVLFSNALIAALTPDEVTAILGHEVAHLEEFSTRRVAMLVTTPALVLLGTLLVPRVPLGSADVRAAVWPVLFVLALAWRARLRQRRESDSDRRAVELCGDWQALASALTKLHVLGRVPRRWSVEFERRSTHPSLARRLAALRAIGGAPPAAIEPIVIRGRDGTTWVTIEPDRVRHLRDVPQEVAADPAALAAAAGRAVSLSYPQLREVRVVASGTASAVLRLRDIDGRSWTCPLDPADLARVQAALDATDHLISHTTPTDNQPARLGLAITVAIAVLGVLLHFTAITVLGILTAISLSSGAMLAAGIGLVALIAGVAAGLPWAPSGGVLTLALLGVLAAAAILCAGRWKPGPSTRPWLAPALLALATLIVWIIGGLLSPGLLTLHRLATQNPVATILPCALVGALWRLPGRRAWAALAGALALTGVVVASPWFERNIVKDPLMADVRPFNPRELSLSRLASAPVPSGAIDPRVSPDGRRFVVAIEDEDEEPSGKFVVGTVGGSVETVTAEDVEFADSNHVLLLSRDAGGTSLQARDFLDLTTARWRLQLDVPDHGDLVVDAETRHWRVTARAGAELLRITGVVGASETHVTRWSLPANGPYQWIVGDDGLPLGVERRMPRTMLGQLSAAYAYNLRIPSYPGSLHTLGPDGRTQLLMQSEQDVQCPEAAAGRPVYCLATDRRATWVWAYQRGALRPVGRLDEQLIATSTPDGLLVGWEGSRPVMIDPQRRERLDLDLGAGTSQYGDWTSAGTSLGVLLVQEGGREIVTYARH